MSINVTIRSVIDDLNDKGITVTTSTVLGVMERDYPEEIAEHGSVLAQQAVRNIASRLMTTRDKNEQLALEGMEFPRWLVRKSEAGEFEHVPLKVATLADHAADIEVKANNAEAAMAELRFARTRDAILWSAPGAHDAMLIADAAKALGQAAA